MLNPREKRRYHERRKRRTVAEGCGCFVVISQSGAISARLRGPDCRIDHHPIRPQDGTTDRQNRQGAGGLVYDCPPGAP